MASSSSEGGLRVEPSVQELTEMRVRLAAVLGARHPDGTHARGFMGAGHAKVSDGNPLAGFFKEQAALLNENKKSSPSEEVQKLHTYLRLVATKYKGAPREERQAKKEMVAKVAHDYGLLASTGGIKHPEVRAWLNSHPAVKQKTLALYVVAQRTLQA